MVYNMSAQNHTVEDIAAAVGIPVSHVHVYLARSVRMDGFPPLGEKPLKIAGALKADPEAVGNVLAAAMVAEVTTEARCEVDKFKDLHEACKDAGLPPKIVSALLRRLRTTLAPVMEAGKRLTTDKLTEKLDEKIAMTLGYIDDYSAANASFKDLNIGLSVMIEKRELLSSRPTHIIDFTSRRELRVVMPALLAEARRRGITVDSTATVVHEPG